MKTSSTNSTYDAYGERMAFLRFAGLRNMRVLDVGAGKGVSSVIAVQDFSNRVTIIDPNADQIEKAREHIRSYGIGEEIGFIQADISDSRLEDGSFEAVICYNALHHIPQHRRARALREMYRLGGHGLVISELNEQGVYMFDTEVHPGSDHARRRVEISWLEKELQNIGTITGKEYRSLTNFYKVK